MKNWLLGITIAVVLVLFMMKLVQPSIEGRWVADHVIDGQSDTLSIEAGVVQLNIEDDNYTFLSTLNQREQGTIEHNDGELLIKNDSGITYKMYIEGLSKSHLIILMNADGISRKLVMSRID